MLSVCPLSNVINVSKKTIYWMCTETTFRSLFTTYNFHTTIQKIYTGSGRSNKTAPSMEWWSDGESRWRRPWFGRFWHREQETHSFSRLTGVPFHQKLAIQNKTNQRSLRIIHTLTNMLKNLRKYKGEKLELDTRAWSGACLSFNHQCQLSCCRLEV